MIPITCNAVGDILALVTLFLDIARALDEARGSPAKWRALNSELKSLHIVLASVARVAEHTTDTLLRDEIVREVNRCSDDVHRALERVAEFSTLGRDESPDDVCSIKTSWPMTCSMRREQAPGTRASSRRHNHPCSCTRL
ncbi:unnamed protein product [Peniophora sp. CBMAI 1063]|nr:unnamed protein product [Peniophora sp. CBMAI 1063]